MANGVIGAAGFRIAWAVMDCGAKVGIAVEIGSWRKGARIRLRG